MTDERAESEQAAAAHGYKNGHGEARTEKG